MTIHVVLVGPDRGLGPALESRGARVARVDGVGSGESLRAAGIEDADLLVLTDVGEATAVPVALEVNPELRVVVYAPDALPEFVRGQVDLAVSPALLDAAVVAEELTGD
ncbi:MAG: CTP synthetase [Halobacteriales archaeon]